METTTETELANPVITRKTQELCQAILDQPEFQSIRQRIDKFMADESVKTLYRELSEKGALLQHKQQTGMPLDGQEITDFEQKRESFLNNPIAQGFLDAQQAVHGMQESVTQYVSKTFELGRLPLKEDFEDGSCGHGCGCSH